MKLIYFLNSKKKSELNLDPEKTYIFGRGKEADVKLEKIPGISRKHFKLYFSENAWRLEKLTDKSSIYFENEAIDQIEIKDGYEIKTESYVFIFGEKQEAQQKSVNDEKTPKPYTQLGTSLFVDHEKAYLKLIERDTEKSFEILKNDIIIGRDPTSDIVLNEVAVSRYHFKISKKNKSYFIEDLGGLNATHLNGLALKKGVLTQLESKDKISIASLEIRFEIIQSKAIESEVPEEIKASELPVEANLPPLVLSKNSSEMAAIRIKKNQKNILRMVLISVIAFGVCGATIFSFLTEKKGKPKEKPKAQVVSENPQFDALNDSEKSIILRAYEYANIYKAQAKYMNCIEQIKKIEEFINQGRISQYKNIKSIKTGCEEAQKALDEQLEYERRERQQKETAEKIEGIVLECQSKVESFKTVEDAEICLEEVLKELDPSNTDAQDILTQVKQRLENIKAKKAESEKRKKIRKKALREFNKALKSFKEKKYHLSIKLFNQFLKKKYRMKKQNKIAKQKIKEAKKKIYQVVLNQVDQCSKDYKSRNLEKAFNECKKAHRLDSTHKTPIKILKEIEKTMRYRLQPLYQKSLLEEEVGSLKQATSLWKEIISKSFPKENYYEKAKRHLKKHGEEIQ